MNQWLTLLLVMHISFSGVHVNANESLILCDGKVENEEYSNQLSFSDGIFELFWEVVGEQIYFAMVGKTDGYLGISVDPELLLRNADLYYGFINESGDFMVDTFSTGLVGPIEEDRYLGGTYDIIEFKGIEGPESTIFEFTRLLDTNDQYDNKIPLGEIPISWSLHDSDDFTDKPNERGSAMINFKTGEGKETISVIYYYLAGIGFVGIIGLYVLFRFIKARKAKK